jgi:hypothetical protein
LQASEVGLILTTEDITKTFCGLLSRNFAMNTIVVIEDQSTKQCCEQKPYPFGSKLDVRRLCGNLIYPIAGALAPAVRRESDRNLECTGRTGIRSTMFRVIFFCLRDS